MSNRTNITSESLLTPAEVATLFRVDPKTVTRWAKAGRISSIRTLGGHRRYKESEVRALLAGDGEQQRTVTIEQVTAELRAAFPLDSDTRWAVVERIRGTASAVPYSAKTRGEGVLDERARDYATQTGARFIAPRKPGGAK